MLAGPEGRSPASFLWQLCCDTDLPASSFEVAGRGRPALHYLLSTIYYLLSTPASCPSFPEVALPSNTLKRNRRRTSRKPNSTHAPGPRARSRTEQRN